MRDDSIRTSILTFLKGKSKASTNEILKHICSSCKRSDSKDIRLKIKNIIFDLLEKGHVWIVDSNCSIYLTKAEIEEVLTKLEIDNKFRPQGINETSVNIFYFNGPSERYVSGSLGPILRVPSGYGNSTIFVILKQKGEKCKP